MKRTYKALLLVSVLLFTSGFVYAEKITGKWVLDSLQITKIIVGSVNSPLVDYEEVKHVVNGIFDAIEFESDDTCKLTTGKIIVSTSYIIRGNVLTIKYKEQKWRYIYSVDETSFILKRDQPFEKPSDEGHGYKSTMLFKKE